MKWFTDDFWFCSIDGETTSAAAAVETPTGPGTAVAAQETLEATAKPSTLLTEDKPAEKPVEAPVVYDETKLTFPEGATPDKESLSKFGEIAKAAGLSQSVAQQLMDLYANVTKVESSKNHDAWKTTRDGWVTEVKERTPEIVNAVAGELRGLDAVKTTVSKVIDNPALTHPKFREALELTGIGDNPAAIVTMYRWAKALTEGSGVAGAMGDQVTGGRQTGTNRTAASVLYPNLNQTER